MHDCVLVLDFGSQFTQLIARRVRELGIYSEIRPCTISPKEIDSSKIMALILSGGPASVKDSNAPPFDPEWLKLGLPTLGICYGMQLLAHLEGGTLGEGTSREYGYSTLEVVRGEGLFSGFHLGERTPVWMSHGDHVERLPAGYELLAKSPGSPCAAMGNARKKRYATMFHLEVVHTPRGKDVLSNFLFGIAGLKPNWSPTDFIAHSIENIRATVSSRSNVVCALSGGVDSTVAACLVHKAIGDRLTCVFVDNGVLRKDEALQVLRKVAKDGLGLNVRFVDASKRFLEGLRGVIDPEEKRKIIGRLFIDVFDEEAHSISNVTHLVQGTLYPDVIESVSFRGGPSVTIKTHHNVGGLPEKMKLKLIEPFRELFKDEVRRLAPSLNIPDDIIQRQPFPGPGLAVRILGEVTEERLNILREADAIFHEEVMAEGLYNQLWQSFAVLLPINSVGVMGDYRTYEQTVVLRAVHSEDGMTADWAYLPQELLRRSSNRIINEVRGVNRVAFDISSKPPATIEWE